MPKKQVAPGDWRESMRRHVAQAEFLAAAADYDTAVERRAVTSYEDDLLRARIMLKHDGSRAVAFLARRPPKAQSGSQYGQWALFLGVGYSRAGDFERADRHFDSARRHLKTSPERAQIAYHLARRALLEGNLRDAWSFADEMLGDKSPATRVANEMLRSFIFCQEERYRDCAQALINAIGLIGKRREQHLEQWFQAVQDLALLGAEIAFAEAAALARTEVDQPVEWPQDFAAMRFQALKAVGWSYALRGNLPECFHYLRAAEESLSSEPFKAILLLDRAYLAGTTGEPNWQCDQVAKAESIAESIDWSACAAEERVGLLRLAEATAAIDPQRSRHYLARYNSLDRIRSPLPVAFDRRIEAYAAYAEGVVRAAARMGGAEESLRDAWVVFDRIGYDWRAARTALRLLELTKKARWRHLAEDKLEAFPQSWLVRELRELSCAPAIPVIKLPPMQHKVFSMLCRKMSTAQIASELGLSQHTVRNHLKSVFRAYGVNNRAALVAEAAGRGDLSAL